jgi:hypothetical protein
VEAWADHVRQLAQEVLASDGREEERVAGDRLLTDLMEGGLADELRSHGLRGAADHPTPIGDIVRWLHESGQSPAAAPPLDGAASSLGPLAALFAEVPGGWDVASPHMAGESE